MPLYEVEYTEVSRRVMYVEAESPSAVRQAWIDGDLEDEMDASVAGMDTGMEIIAITEHHGPRRF